MAASASTTNRRAVLVGATAALVAGSALSTAAAPAAGDPVFAAMKRETRAAWDMLDGLYAEQERRIDALGPLPVLPEELLEPLRLPGKRSPSTPPKEGWSAKFLEELVIHGTSLTGETIKTALGATVRTEWKPISAKTRRRAAELLNLRKAYEAERDAWWEKAQLIEGESAGPLGHAIDLAFDLMAYPVFTVAEVKDKLAMVEEWDLFGLAEGNEGEANLRNALLRDALAAAEKAVANV